MNPSKHRGRLIRTALVLLALALGIGPAAVGAPASPAYASADYIMLCLPILDRSGQIVDWDCHPFELPQEVDPCPDCPDWAFNFDHLVLPADPYYIEDLMSGFRLLERAALADPQEAPEYREAAQAAFLAAAERLGETEVRLGETGFVDWELNIIRPDPDPWLVAAGTDVGNGIGLLHQALAEPDPDPWLAAAMAAFEEAYQEIIQRQPIGC
jgi:hypothetical protein